MQRKTTEAISRKLRAEFGSGYRILADTSKQNLIEPCFYIHIVSTNQEQRLGRNYRRNQSFDIHYFPEEEHSSEEISDVAERLYSCLEYVEIAGKLYRGSEMKAEIQEKVLHFMVDYNIPLRKQAAEEPYMEELEVNGITG